MIARLKEISGALAAVLPEELELKTDDLQLMDDVLLILGPVTQVTTQLQAAKYTTISDTAVIWQSLLATLGRFRVPSAEEKKQPYDKKHGLFRTDYAAPIRDRLVFSLTYRGIVHTRGKHVVLASLLDARYRSSAFDLKSDWLFPVAVQETAIADLRRMERELGGAVAPAVVPAAPPVQKEEEDLSRLQLVQPPVAAAAPIPAAAAVTEMDRYLMLPRPSIAELKDKDASWAVDWWRQNESKFPILSRIAKRYLAIPTSSAEPERVWSAAKLICADLRGRLINKTFIDHLLIHRNKDLLIDSD